MKLRDLKEQPTPTKPGTYAAVKFDDSTNSAISQYVSDNNIPNGCAVSKLHTTVVYSRKHLPDLQALGTISPPWVGTPTELDVFDTRPTDGSTPKRCLVLKYVCPELDKRHNFIMDEHEAQYDFDEYIPHVTLSYDIGELDIKKLPDVSAAIPEIRITSEYVEDLNLSWANGSTKE